jgi:hypothetical protein
MLKQPPAGFRLLLLVPLFVLCSGCAQKASTSVSSIQFEQYKSDSGKFSVLFPGEPVEETKEFPTDDGIVELHVIQLWVSNSSGYGVLYIDVPLLTLEGGVQKVLTALQDAGVKRGTVLSAQEIAVGQQHIPGREMLVLEEGVYVRTRIFLHGRRFYKAVVRGSSSQVKSQDADRFFNSFVVMD